MTHEVTFEPRVGLFGARVADVNRKSTIKKVSVVLKASFQLTVQHKRSGLVFLVFEKIFVIRTVLLKPRMLFRVLYCEPVGQTKERSWVILAFGL